ncbi:MAG: hypothetical protein J5997_06675 [Oscillospiraceae bacterium]|nr:hypothetical protein [Oscillospiraceae bacterium]
MYITRLQAIDIAISAINQLPDSKENRQAVMRLLNIKKDCKSIIWTKGSVRQALDEWAESHGRNPTVTDLVEPNMPKAVTIQKLFDMKASAFLNTYYSTEKRKTQSSRYSVRSREEWIADFTAQYNAIRPASAKEYDIKRDKDSPTWLTIARYLGVATWKDLLELTGARRGENEAENISHYTVEHSSPAYDKITELLAKR